MYPKSVVIIGGSVAGLLQGLQLKRNGTDVTILEQDPSKDRHSHESGVTIGPSVVSLLEKYDATGHATACYAEYLSAAWRMRLRVVNVHWAHYMSNWGCLYQVLRANFDGVASEAVPNPPKPLDGDGKVEYWSGIRVTGMSYDKDKGRVEVIYTDVLSGRQGRLSAETVIAADGLHSSVRQILKVPTRREYAGYIGWRGTVPEKLFYFIPTESGRLDAGERLVNWVWYFVVADESEEMKDIFTDIHGKLHSNTVPQGLVKPDLWARHIARHKAQMIAPLAEIVSKTPRPFVTKVGEAQCMQSTFYDGLLVLVGDSFTSFRSHRGMASEQAARHCWQMDRVWRGEITQEQRDREAVFYARKFILVNRLIGLAGLGHVWQLIKTCWAYAWLMFIHRLGMA